ncbi:sensor histidine kinase [Paenibacillus hamazuiensis]|uniref:sensor histidine kinase n=1 Tax=Paenibacillus hamazuiensis TaxID=2936508 RepID=UPI00200F675F|nr:ATP-binding protein [Paenibacillus hamazuiensis]
MIRRDKHEHALVPQPVRKARFPWTWFPFSLLKKLYELVKKLYSILRSNVEKSIRFQLVLTFAFCLLASMLFYAISSSFFGEMNREAVIDYSSGIHRIDGEAQRLVRMLEPDPDAKRRVSPPVPTPAPPSVPAPGGSSAAEARPGASSVQSGAAANAPQTWPLAVVKTDDPQSDDDEDDLREERVQDHIRNMVNDYNYKVVLTDLEGKVIYRTENAAEITVDIHKVIKNAMDTRVNEMDNRKEFSSFYPVTYHGQKSYLIVSGIPEPNISYRRGESPLSLLTSIAFFILLFYYLTQRKMRYIEDLASGMRIIATGNLDYRMVQRSKDELGSLANDMNVMVEELQRKIEEERRAERTKNELITNVSHDLRTPLTLIIGYLRLLHDKKYENEEQASSYLSIAVQKSEKLKVLIEDLFQFTKLSNQDIPMHIESVSLNEMLEQLLEEYVSIAEDQQLQIVRHLPQERLLVRMDVDQMIRVFENLLTNAVKYSLKPGTIKVLMTREKRDVLVRVTNRTEHMPQEDLARLFDRFYRVDDSRSSETGGSGLGLAIAKTIVDAHGGQIWAETEGDEIHFYVKMKLVEPLA